MPVEYQEECRLPFHTDHADDLSSREKIEAQHSSRVDLHDSTYPDGATWTYLIWPNLWSVTDPAKNTES